MSGPKSYDTSISITVFNGALSSIFKAQADIQGIYNILLKACISDHRLSLHFNYSAQLKTLQNEILSAITSFTLGHQGLTVSDSQHSEYTAIVNDKLKKLQVLLTKLSDIYNDFLKKKHDHSEYLRYEDAFTAAGRNLELLKLEIVSYLEKHIKSDHPDLFKIACDELKRILFTAKKAEFEFGFTNVVDKKLKEISSESESREREISSIRIRLCDSINSVLLQKAVNTKITLSKVPDKIERYDHEIGKLINACENLNLRKTWSERLETLHRNDIRNSDPFFHIELLEEIRTEGFSESWKLQITDYITQVNRIPIARKYQTQADEIRMKASALLEKTIIKKREKDEITHRYSIFNAANIEALRLEETKTREQHYIKAKIIESLQALDYEVITDMQVIDLENGNDFLMSVPRQDNYIALHFDSNEGLSYQFVIPEERKMLSIDDENRKVAQMESTCDDWKKLIKELAGQGLSFDLKSERLANKNVLFQVPKKHSEAVRKRKKSSSVQHTSNTEKKHFIR